MNWFLNEISALLSVIKLVTPVDSLLLDSSAAYIGDIDADINKNVARGLLKKQQFNISIIPYIASLLLKLSKGPTLKTLRHNDYILLSYYFVNLEKQANNGRIKETYQRSTI